MFARDLMEDWSLLKFEEDLVKIGTKALFLCSEEIFNKVNQIYHTNGMSFKVVRKFRSTFSKLDNNELDKFGIRRSIIAATCEHPDFHTWTYDGYACSSYNGRSSAMQDYIKRHPELGLVNTKQEYCFVETNFYPSPRSKVVRDKFDQARLDKRDHYSMYGY